MLIRKEFIHQIKEIIFQARDNAVRSVDFQRVVMYWHIGKTIFEEEQHGQERATYGEFIIKNLAFLLIFCLQLHRICAVLLRWVSRFQRLHQCHQMVMRHHCTAKIHQAPADF